MNEDDEYYLSVAGGPKVQITMIEMNREALDVGPFTSWVADPDWLHEDANGHLHAWFGLDEKPRRPRVPSCRKKVTTVYCPDCRDDHDQIDYLCLDCGALVEPKYRASYEPARQLPGPAEITLHTDRDPVPSRFTYTTARDLPATVTRGMTALDGKVWLASWSPRQEFRWIPNRGQPDLLP
jgi:hypothetical protein